MKRLMTACAGLFLLMPIGLGQAFGQSSAQALIEVTGGGKPPALGDMTVSVDSKKEGLQDWMQIPPASVQMAFLIDDSLSTDVNIELEALRSFTRELPPGVQVFIGYMRGGEVYQAQAFTTDHEAAAKKIRPVSGSSNGSSSAYFSLTKFVTAWPADRNHPAARFALLLTSGKDQFTGHSGENLGDTEQNDDSRQYNQKSPYVRNAIQDAEAAGVTVSAVFYRDQAGSSAAVLLTGQGYLAELCDATGGHAYENPNFTTAFLAPYLKAFQDSVTHTYVATFAVKNNAKGLVYFKVNTKASDVKLRTAEQINVRNIEIMPAAK